MANLFQEIYLIAGPWQGVAVILVPVGYVFLKYLRKREEKFYKALYRRERITRRLLEY
jgi:hypothetical protein